GAVSMLAATFIVFSTLSMGVTERQRTLAMLRAIGAYRGQVARLVIIEGAYLGLAGAMLGVPFGLLWTFGLTRWKASFFSAGMVVDWTGVLMGVGAAVGAAL